MLYNSKKLVNGPKFPNLKSIGDYGLADAFNNCSSLSSVELPSAPLSVRKYGFREAFAESGIKTVENLNLSGIGQYGCQGMFLSCAELEKVDGLSAKIFSAAAFFRMFDGCSALTSVNDLHLDGSALTVANIPNKCAKMFYNCSSLLSVSGMISGVFGNTAFRYMF